MDINVFKQLQTITPVEQQQLDSHLVNDDIPPDAIDLQATQEAKIPVLNDYFFKNRSIVIRKHRRFAPYPLHTHQFFEMNYMLRGHAHEVVNGTAVDLSQGDVILLDIGSEHKIATLGKDDLLINILFRDRNISIDFFHQLQATKSVLYDFLVNRLTPKKNQPTYILFKNQRENSDIRYTIERLIDEYYRQEEFSDTIIQSELTILIALLVRNYQVPVTTNSPTQALAIKMLQDIREHYQKLSLEDLADRYSYSRNYLGNLFRKEVGRTFSEALTEERMLRARELIQNTSDPISTICRSVGIANKSFFYHKYAEQFGHAPREDRNPSTSKSIISSL